MINIFYLSHNRLHYNALTFYFLNKIKPENKLKIQLTILATHAYPWELLNGISMQVINFPSHGTNYFNKVNHATQTSFKYSIKLDEDCFINNHVWDYIIENIHLLDDPNTLLLSPVMSNNIPSCDMFIEDYITDDKVKSEIYQHFLKREMPNGLWGVDYSPLNQHTIIASTWDSYAFYNSVSKATTNIKGIHPLRICYEAQVLVNDYILKNTTKFIEQNPYEFVEIPAPYFTNSLFAIKTSEWKKILDMRMDEYDEISLNNYRRQTNKKLLFLKGGFGIHPMYNTVFGNMNPWGIGTPNGAELEQEFYNNLKTSIIQ